MKVFLALLLGAVGVALIFAGATGSAQSLFTSIFGRNATGSGNGPISGATAEAGAAAAGSAATKAINKNFPPKPGGTWADNGGGSFLTGATSSTMPPPTRKQGTPIQ